MTWPNVAVCDVAADLGGHLIVEGDAGGALQLDFRHGNTHSSIILAPPRSSRPLPALDAEPQAVIREARRRQRRRRLVIGASVASVLVVLLVVVLIGGHKGGPSGQLTPQARDELPSRAPSGVEPLRPEALAVGPHGTLYVADGLRDQILERRADGRFRVVAGTGKRGFSGDGGPATGAEIDWPGGMTTATDGTLYFADQANGRIRAVSRSGIMTTVAGNGLGGWVPDGTRALDASLIPAAVAIGPDGLLYIAEPNEVLRLSHDGTLTRVMGTAGAQPGLTGLGGPAADASADGAYGLAFDGPGNLYVAGFNTRTILVVNTMGIVHVSASLNPRDDGGLTRDPSGHGVLAMGELSVVHLGSKGQHTVASFDKGPRGWIDGIRKFSPDGIAVSPQGTIYVDSFAGNGFADRSAIAALPRGGSWRVLWESKASTNRSP